MSTKYKILIWIILISSLLLAPQTVFAMSPTTTPTPSPSPTPQPQSADEPDDNPNQEPPKEKEFIVEGPKADFNMGNSGVSLPSASPGDKVKITKLSGSQNKGVLQAINIDMNDEQIGVYAVVYFNLNTKEYEQFKAGEIGMYKYDSEKDEFIKLTSFSVYRSGDGRIATCVDESGTYVLAQNSPLSKDEAARAYKNYINNVVK